MNNPVIGNLSKYYQSIISRLNTPELEKSVFAKYALYEDLITGYGTIVYNVNHQGFYGIIDDHGNKYYPINEKQFSNLFLDRKEIQFSLRLHPEIGNLFRWGTTVNVIAIQLLD